MNEIQNSSNLKFSQQAKHTVCDAIVKIAIFLRELRLVLWVVDPGQVTPKIK
jgi:hypothetical protein